MIDVYVPDRPNSEATLTYTVPDTITSWVASAFAMNENVGLGLSEAPATVRVKDQIDYHAIKELILDKN